MPPPDRHSALSVQALRALLVRFQIVYACVSAVRTGTPLAAPLDLIEFLTQHIVMCRGWRNPPLAPLLMRICFFRPPAQRCPRPLCSVYIKHLGQLQYERRASVAVNVAIHWILLGGGRVCCCTCPRRLQLRRFIGHRRWWLVISGSSVAAAACRYRCHSLVSTSRKRIGARIGPLHLYDDLPGALSWP